jgi:hypothetical protein
MMTKSECYLIHFILDVEPGVFRRRLMQKLRQSNEKSIRDFIRDLDESLLNSWLQLRGCLSPLVGPNDS